MTRRPAEGLRIGCVKYLNARPLISGWDTQVDFDHPAALCRKLANGELDVAFVSSFEFLEHPIYTIADDIAVGSDGCVDSVLLVHTVPIRDIEEVVLDPASRTSANLLRCLFAQAGLNPCMVASSASPPAITTKSARLLIGDQAIRFRQAHRSEYQYRDLGEWWNEATDLPFVFALWLIRPEVQDAKRIADQLRTLRDRNLSSLDKIIADETQFSAEFCRHYFRDCLQFGFAEQEKKGLLRFRELCEKHGILQANAAPLRLI